MKTEQAPLLVMLALAIGGPGTLRAEEPAVPTVISIQPQPILNDLRDAVKRRLTSLQVFPQSGISLDQKVQFMNFPNFPNFPNFLNAACFRGFWRNC